MFFYGNIRARIFFMHIFENVKKAFGICTEPSKHLSPYSMVSKANVYVYSLP